MAIVILFDTETTGLIKPSASDIDMQPYITDIYCMKIEQDGNEFQVLDEFETLLSVPIPLSEEITRITGLTDNHLKGKPRFCNIYEKLAKFFTGADRVVAHNLAFDRAMLATELHRIDKVLHFPWPWEHICTVEKSLFIEQRRMNLTRLHEHFFGKGFTYAHRAKNDVCALYECYKMMVKENMI